MNEHIIELLESGPLAQLAEPEWSRIAAHAGTCAACHQAYSVARLAERLLQSRTAEIVEPPPFFQTRVLAAWRERNTVGDLWNFARLWRSAGALVSSMAATVAVLAAVTFIVPAPATVPNQTIAQATAYSAEDVIFAGDDGSGSVSDGQAATTILDADDEIR